MTINPIAVVEQVLEEYRSHLRTEFRARDEKLRDALEAALREPTFLAQQPFFQAHRPFKAGAKWADLGLDAAVAKVMRDRSRSATAYLHQSDAIQHLLQRDATPVVVTTGTGSGKSECFLLPVIQNAIEDSTRFKRSGLTAVLVYPMNALANDQLERIEAYLKESGHTHVKVARYDRSTKQDVRERMRKDPPHILLTNYMMLEYLLVRPSDRDALFANHRVRYAVLDEVHTYRGSLGANIALLIRRLGAHLRHATHDFAADDRTDERRFPKMVLVGTSATIKSIDESARPAHEIAALRDSAVQEFFGTLTGAERSSIRVVSETIVELEPPKDAAWSPAPTSVASPSPTDPAAVRAALAALSGIDEPRAEVAALGRRTAILWTLSDLLARRPMSLDDVARKIIETVPARLTADFASVRREVEVALVAGAALPDDAPGALRLRAHRFVRGGWRFVRCVDPSCGRLYPMGEADCECGRKTAPLYLCRGCGADTLRFRSKPPEDPSAAALEPNDSRIGLGEWLLYDLSRYDDADADDADGFEDRLDDTQKMKERPVTKGSFDPATLSFVESSLYDVRCVLAPGRNRCLVCGSSAGAHPIMTPVGLGTSAATRVLAEGLVEGLAAQHVGDPTHDGKERLLIFADSRQDAAHQARFISYAGRYDRMRRRIVQAVRRAPDRALPIGQAVVALTAEGFRTGDNPLAERYRDIAYVPQAVQSKAAAWEEAPLLDDISVTSGYRATVLNLGLLGIRYEHLESYIEKRGAELAARWGITTGQLTYVARCVLDEMRRRGALSRPLLAFHPAHTNCPEDYKKSADWERRLKQPAGYACTRGDRPLPVGQIERGDAPHGVQVKNWWRAPKAGGRGPGIERLMKRLLARMGGAAATEESILELVALLMREDGPQLIKPVKLYGLREERHLLQVNADAVLLYPPGEHDRMRCSICNVRLAGVPKGSPCPACPGTLRPWGDDELAGNRYVARIVSENATHLVAAEHTAQITGDARIQLEENFKGPPSRSALNVLACSPTLEMGIDVGGLDAVLLRNVPPRPDNYAQRGGRAGRRSRVGVVVGYTRSTPHDGYFFDRPSEMIAGEVPAPGVGLGNRDVVMRHLHAIAFGAADPGLAGKMGEYITVTGELITDKVDALVAAVAAQTEHTLALARDAWGSDVLAAAQLTETDLRDDLASLDARVRDIFDRVRLQVVQLRERINQWAELGFGDRGAINAMDLVRRMLGIRSDKDQNGVEADDRTSGHPMRRFAEFGILPGYEFPTEPATLRLLGDGSEEEPISVARRFGIAQYQPDATAHARGHRWRIAGLDTASPWNPRTPEPTWLYSVCAGCGLRYGTQDHVRCPRCLNEDTTAHGLPGHEFGGFLAVRDDTPVLEEEDRFSMASLVQPHAQWNGHPILRYDLATGLRLQLRHGETVRWLNESKEPSKRDNDEGRPALHGEARGFYLCPSCGRLLTVPETAKPKKKPAPSRRPLRGGNEPDVYGHGHGCDRAGQPPVPRAIVAATTGTTLRMVVHLPYDANPAQYGRWGYSLGYSLRIGMRHLYTLDGAEVDFVLENLYQVKDERGARSVGALTFIDGAVGGSGFLDRAARDMHLVALRAIDHLDHPNCESACYRCLKSYNNQRHHELLFWPEILPELEAIAAAAPVLAPAELGDSADPQPWLEAFDAGVASPLELKFLRLFEAHGIEVEKQVAVAAREGEPAISTADFVLKGQRVAIYVDGAAFHRGERLRRDRIIRQKLEAGGWRVVTLRAADLRAPDEVARQVRRP